ncbi:MAG: hypothetical protein ING19_17345 [Azospirillum sp.]|nr:hypothetical protein [Azospirillum sp.]
MSKISPQEKPMSIKVTIDQIEAFFATNDTAYWPKGSYVEDDLYRLDDGREVSDVDWSKIRAEGVKSVVVMGGSIVPEEGGSEKSKDLISVMKRWIKAQEFASVIVTVPKERVEDFKTFVSGIGGRLSP